jgi:hypothetical protein
MLVVLLGAAILAYLVVGAGGVRAGLAALTPVVLLVVGLLRARRDPGQAAAVARIASRSLMLLPGALLVYLSFEAGGFFPGPPSLVAVLLGLLLAARLIGGRGVAGGGRLLAATTAAVAAYAAWVLLSGTWSHAFDRAWTEADLALVYGLGFVLFAISVKGTRDLRWVMAGLAAGASTVCLGAFLSRALPKLWPIAASLDTPRISYPLTYWNALGMVAVVGIILCVALTSDDRASRFSKALAVLPLPLLAVTLLLTFSRGANAAGVVGLVAFLILGRPRSLIGTMVGVAPTALALVVAYRATSLATALDGSPLQASQGRHVATVVAACALAGFVGRLLFGGIDARLVRLADRHPVSTAAALRLWGAAAVLVLVGALAFGLPGALSTQYHRFIQGNHERGSAQLRDRLFDPGADGRLDHWRVAIDEFDTARLHGTGAGTFELAWNAHHPPQDGQVLDAHSIYVENLAELGIVGLGLLACVILGLLVGVGRRIRGPQRVLYAGVFAITLAWALRAGIDWDWEMPAVTLPVFVLAGAAFGRPAPAPDAPRRRPLLGLGALAAAAVAALLNVSQGHLDSSVAAFTGNDCATATSQARSALAPLGFRRAAHEILAYCEAARGDRAAAAADMASAVDDDPQNWEVHYGMAVVLAVAGRDPRPATRAARALDPSGVLIKALSAELQSDPRGRWAIDAASVPLPVGGQNTTSVAGLRAGLGRSARPVRSSRPR